jgi:hypothetical protein
MSVKLNESDRKGKLQVKSYKERFHEAVITKHVHPHKEKA